MNQRSVGRPPLSSVLDSASESFRKQSKANWFSYPFMLIKQQATTRIPESELRKRWVQANNGQRRDPGVCSV
jgi:hypothetical protein